MKYNTRIHPEQIAKSSFLAQNATLLGDVHIGEQSSIWFGAVVRGDTETIEIGDQTNIQDLCVVHADQNIPCRIGNRVTVGHAAIVHGATVEDEVMIGMRAVVLNQVEIGQGSLIAAGAVIPEGTIVPPNSVVMGLPGKVVREVNSVDSKRIQHAWQHYVEAAAAFKQA